MKDSISKTPSVVTNFIAAMTILLDTKSSRDALSFEAARDQSESGDILGFLQTKFPEVDLSLFKGDIYTDFNERMKGKALDFYDHERKKLGVENNGICLLLAYAMEIIGDILFKR